MVVAGTEAQQKRNMQPKVRRYLKITVRCQSNNPKNARQTVTSGKIQHSRGATKQPQKIDITHSKE